MSARTDFPCRVLGADITSAGVRYTVWAPEKKKIEVHVQRAGSGQNEVLPLEEMGNGYFVAEDQNGRAGDTYSFRVEGGREWPDVASRFQPHGYMGPSLVVDPTTYAWKTTEWKRPAWGGQVIYELHVGAFTAEGTYRAAMERLDHLVKLGVTAVELMPLSECSGARNWGYDGVLLSAPYHVYGAPDDLRAFIDECHGHGLAVILDVVYNHIGAIGDSTQAYSKFYAHEEDSGAWGRHYNLDGPNALPVRNFLLQNIAYWLEEYRIDGFRFDATHAIRDNSKRHFVAEATELLRAHGGFAVAEDERNVDKIFKPAGEGGWDIDAVWADDFHHTFCVSQTREARSYLACYSGTLEEIADTLRHGWLFRGQLHPKTGKPVGTPSLHLPPESFVHCISNHDQAGNRPYGERLNHLIPPGAYRALSLFFCLTPYTPLLFMGQEWGASSPFLFFSDHPTEFGRLVAEGRKREFQFEARNPGKPLPDCQSISTFQQSKLRWDEIANAPHAGMLSLYREALGLRRDYFSGSNPARESWSVEVHADKLSLIYQWPTRALEVTFCTSREAAEATASAGRALLRSGEKRFGGNAADAGPETVIAGRTAA